MHRAPAAVRLDGPMTEPSLTQRWPLPDHLAPLRRLLTAWGAPERGYHDLLHLSEVLDRLDELAAAGTTFDQLPVRLAAWYHDAIYDGGVSVEERSAQWAVADLTELGVDSLVVHEVQRLVRVTIDHRVLGHDPNAAALVDADLAILAAAPARYASYAAGVRTEYAHVPDDDFARGRSAVLRGLLAQERMFATEHGHTTWERLARENATRELGELTAEAL